jgi:TolA-binding protein
VDEASKRAAQRLEELRRRESATSAAPLPDEGEIRQRYEALLQRPGTPEDRKPELLLRLAEIDYREEEAAMRAAYEAGEGDAVPPGDRYPRAVARFRELVDRFPASPQALTAFYNLGYLYAEEGDGELSTWAYGEVLARDPQNPYADEIHMRLAEAAFDAGRVEEAIPHYLAVVRGAKPEYADKALYKLGWCFFNLEDYSRAVDSFSLVLGRGQASPEDLRRETLSILAKALLEWGGLGPLTSYLRSRPEAEPYGPTLHRLLGELYADSSRYREAVAVYAAGVEAYPLAPECLALERGILSALLIARDGEGANERRVLWADRYGPGSAWDRLHGAGPLGAERDELLEEGLRLAALHYHGRAQRGQGGLERALTLYGRYLEIFGASTEAGYELAYAYAQAFREAGRLSEAAAQYRRVAAHPALATHREEASYRRIRVLESLYAEDPGYLEELLGAHEEYVARNPASSLVPEILFSAGELLFGAELFPRARALFHRVVDAAPAAPWGPRAWERIGRCRFREGDYARSEEALRRALAQGLEEGLVPGARQLLSFAIFRQGEEREEAGDREGANGHFGRLADELPEEDAAQVGLYRMAENLRALGRDGDAARVFDRLARRYRGSEYAQSALALSAQIFASLGEWEDAARGFEAVYRSDPEGAGAPDALFRAARALERANRRDGAVRLFAEFAETFPKDPRRAEALFRQGELLRAAGQEEDAAARYREAWAVQGQGDAEAFRARAALALGRLALDRFRGVALQGDLAQALERKERFLTEALEHLARAASLPFADTLTEALFRAGESFEHLKEALLASERPAELTDEEAEEYEFLLEEKAFPLEERAVAYYRNGVGAARDAGVHTPWVDRMFERLETLVPWAYQRTEEPAAAWSLLPPPAPGPEAKL